MPEQASDDPDNVEIGQFVKIDRHLPEHDITGHVDGLKDRIVMKYLP